MIELIGKYCLLNSDLWRAREARGVTGANIDDVIDGRVTVTITKLTGGGMFTEILQVDSGELSNPSEICFFSR